MAASYIAVPRDLTKVKSKVFFNLTKRQLICFGCAVSIGVPAFFLLKQVVSSSTSTFLMMAIMMPFFLLAMYERNGQHLEVRMRHFVESAFLRSKKRLYKTNNPYKVLQQRIETEKEIREILERHERQKQTVNKAQIKRS